MTRIYVDLHLKPDLSNTKQTEAMIKKTSELGYKLVAITLPISVSREQTQNVKDMCASYGVDMATRCDLRPQSPTELLYLLRKVRRNVEIVAAMCTNKAVSRQAAKDRRVDMLNFLGNDYRTRFFDHAEAQLASSCLARFEIDMATLLRSEGSSRIKLFNALRREVLIAQAYRVPIILSSGACDALELRKPLETAVSSVLFDLPREAALDSVSRVPCEVIRGNRAKLGPDFVAPGIRMVRRGKDC